MVSLLVYGLIKPFVWVLSPGWGHCFVFLGKILCSHFVSLHPGVQMGARSNLNVGGNPALDYFSIPSRGEIEILLVTSCYRNRDKL